ncbi:MAG: hypothetical protein ACOC1U_08390, partial [Spirochaetota bacterium]
MTLLQDLDFTSFFNPEFVLNLLQILVWAVLGIGAACWVAWNHDGLADQYGFLEGRLQTGVAIVLLLSVLEAARRAIGWPLPTVAALALAYGLFGQHIPGEFGHSGTPLASFLGTL